MGPIGPYDAEVVHALRAIQKQLRIMNLMHFADSMYANGIIDEKYYRKIAKKHVSLLGIMDTDMDDKQEQECDTV